MCKEYKKLEILTHGRQYPLEKGGTNFPKEERYSLGNLTRGCHIHRGPRFPVTLGKMLSIKFKSGQECSRIKTLRNRYHLSTPMMSCVQN